MSMTQACFTSQNPASGGHWVCAPGGFLFVCEECQGRGYWLEGLHQEEMERVDCPDCAGEGLNLLGFILTEKEQPEPWPGDIG